MPSPSRDRPAIRLMLMLAAAAAAVSLGFGLINGFPHGLTYDDAYFYAQIAYNLGQTGRSTFDGVGTTSGYHLLWGGVLGLLSAVLAPLTDHRSAHLFVLEVAFVALALVVATTFFSRFLERLCVVVLVVMGTLLMETLLLSALLLVVAREEARRAGDRVSGASLVAVLLVPPARIDGALIVGLYVALLAFGRERRAAASLGAALGAGVVAQLGLMTWLFGEPFSVSSIIKASGAAPFEGAIRMSIFGPEGIALGYLVRFVLFVGLAGVAIGFGLAGRSSAVNRRLLYLSVGTVAFSAGHVISQMIPFWCYLPAYLVLFYAITATEAREPTLRIARQVTIGSVAVLSLAFCAHKVYLYTSQSAVVKGARAFVDAIAEHVPPDGRIYQIDGSGFTGFFSGRSVVNGDGLVNTYDYARRVRDGQLAGYLDEQGICYLITNRAPSSHVLVDQGGLVVTTEEVEEVLRTPTYGAFATTDFVLYRRRGC